MTSTSSDRHLAPLPQDPPSRQYSEYSLRQSGTSFTDSEPRTRSSGSFDRPRSSSKESGIYSEITTAFKKLQAQLQDEKHRAENAEREVAEVTAYLKTVNDARLLAMQEAASAKEQLKLYKIQLETAQREIYRAQDVIADVDRQRYAAEKDAAKSRSKARQLNETLVLQAAREEAWRMGLKEGLDKGRNIALAELPYEVPDDLDKEDEYSFEESGTLSTDEDDQPPFQTRPRSVAPSIMSKAPTERSRNGSLPVNIPPILPTAPPSAPPTAPPASRPPSIHPSEYTRPISVRNQTPSVHYPSTPIPDNLIPSLDADNRIRIPPPFEFIRTPERSASPNLPPVSDGQEPLPIPPPAQSQNRHRSHKRNSSSGSSTLSALDIINDPYAGNLRTPMSIIPEVLSQHSGSPMPQSVDGDRSMRHQSSFSGSYQQQPQSLNHMPSMNQFTTETQSQRRPGSRASYASSYTQPVVVQPRYQSTSNLSSTPEIGIQPPSRPLSHNTDSVRGGSRAGGSPVSQNRGLPPSVRSVSYSGDMPGGMYASSPVDPDPSPTEPPSGARRSRHRRGDDEDDAVSSAISGDTLTTPPARYRNMGPDADDGGSAYGHGEGSGRLGSNNTAVWSMPQAEPPAPEEVQTDMTGIGSGGKKKKGKKR